MKAKIYITLKDGVLDPQGQASLNALKHLNFNKAESVRQGKFIELTLAEKDKDKAAKMVTEMCEQLLANTVIENYRFDLIPA